MKHNFKPQTRLVFQHLVNYGSITAVEAAAVYRVRSLSKRISEINHDNADVILGRELRKDATGQRYAHYTMSKSEQKYQKEIYAEELATH